MARVNKKSHGFTCLPRVHPQVVYEYLYLTAADHHDTLAATLVPL